MTREEALQLVNDWTTNKNLVKHMLAVEAIMRALCEFLWEKILDIEKGGSARSELVELWGIAGLVHDADYESYKEDPKKHP